MSEHTPLTKADLDALEARYAGEEVPPCRVCGGELSIGQMGGGEPTKWAHHTPNGVRMGDWTDHYRESIWVERRPGDSRVLDLIAFARDALAARTSTATADTGLRERVERAEALLDSWDGNDAGALLIRVRGALADATAAPTTDTGARDE